MLISLLRVEHVKDTHGEACPVPAVQEAEKHVCPEARDQSRSHGKALSQKSKERLWPRVMESCPSPGGLASCSVLPSAVLEAGTAVEQYLLPVEAAPGLTLEVLGVLVSSATVSSEGGRPKVTHTKMESFLSDTQLQCRPGPRAVVCGQQTSVVIPNN